MVGEGTSTSDECVKKKERDQLQRNTISIEENSIVVERFVEKRDLSQPKTTYGRRWFKLNAVGVAKCNTETCKGHLNYIKILVDLILLKVFPETIIQI